MARSQSYRDVYEGRGKYATEYDAMLDSERSRTAAWLNESTTYQRSLVWPGVLAVIFLAVVVVAVIAFLR